MTDKIMISCECKDFLKIDELVEFQGNLKKRSDSDLEKIIKSIKKFGFSFPFFVWRHDGINHCLDGHGRIGALHKLAKEGFEIPPLPVVYVDCKDEQSAKDLLLRLNSHYGTMTKESVLEFIGDLEIDVSDFELPCGVIEFGDDTESLDTQGDDEVPEVDEKEEPNSQLGEMYELGDSILMCGDATKVEDVARLMGGVEADLLITDHPYNVNYEGGTKDKLKILNDKMEDSNFRQFLVDSFNAFKQNMKKGAAFYIWHADLEGYNFRGACRDVQLQVKECLIWNKNQMVLGRQGYQWKHEPCLYGWAEGDSHSWYSDRKQTTVLDFAKPLANKEHPTMKPVELFEYLIKNSTKQGDVVLDGFGGSGTTLIACEKNGRKARVMELDPHYCDVIRRRYTKWAKENGKPLTSGILE